MIKVKVCGMSDPLNIKVVAEAGPDIMGFIFYPDSPRYVGENPGRSLFQNVPETIEKTGVFVNADSDRVIDAALDYKLDIIQLHGVESPGYCSFLKAVGLKIIKTFSITDEFDFEMLRPYAHSSDYFLFDTQTTLFGGSGKKFNWDILKGYELDKPFFLSGGIGPEDTAEIFSIKNRGLYGVDINSRFEISPGVKDAGLVASFIDKVKNG